MCILSFCCLMFVLDLRRHLPSGLMDARVLMDVGWPSLETKAGQDWFTVPVVGGSLDGHLFWR